jgi:hypothetical protein
LSIGAVFLLVLVALVVLAAASFFRNVLAALLVLIGFPVAIVLQAAIGIGVTIFAISLLAIATFLIHTINETLRELRAANRVRAPRARSDRLRSF